MKKKVYILIASALFSFIVASAAVVCGIRDVPTISFLLLIMWASIGIGLLVAEIIYGD
jgi:hypothetical protein